MIRLAPHVGIDPRPSAESLYLLLMWNVGSRHDPNGQEGLLHFLEHTLFKGTRRRRSRQLFAAVERYGGELNAFTTKDKMAVEMRLPPFAAEVGLRLLAELADEATFPENEVEKEREVILEELAMYEDIPEESLLDHFEEQVFAEGGLRHPILGYVASVQAIQAQDLRTAYARLAHTPWVLLLTGPLSVSQGDKLLARQGWLTRAVGSQVWPTQAERPAPPSQRTFERPIQQIHLVVGGEGPSPYRWEESLPFFLLMYHLGGGQMTSRFNLLLRELYGWAYTVYGFTHTYPERTVWGFYAGLSPEVAEKARRIIHRELDKPLFQSPSSAQLARLKRAYLGRQKLAWENPTYRLSVEARHWLDMGEPFSPQAWEAALWAVEPSHLQAAAEAAFSLRYERAYVPLKGV